jgi:hypothetical protein
MCSVNTVARGWNHRQKVQILKSTKKFKKKLQKLLRAAFEIVNIVDLFRHCCYFEPLR